MNIVLEIAEAKQIHVRVIKPDPALFFNIWRELGDNIVILIVTNNIPYLVIVRQLNEGAFNLITPVNIRVAVFGLVDLLIGIEIIAESSTLFISYTPDYAIISAQFIV